MTNPFKRTRLFSRQVRDEFFALIDRMIANLFRRGQDPNDHVVPDTFTYRTFAEFPKEQKYNMDEVGSDGNKGRKKKVRARDCHPSGSGPVDRSGTGPGGPLSPLPAVGIPMVKLLIIHVIGLIIY